jgi:hypothetical protein
MKKLSLLIVGLTFSLFCFGQNTVALSDAAKLDLPDGMQKISRDDAMAFASKQFNNEPIVMRSIAKRKIQNIYRVKNVLVSLHTENKSTDGGHLAQLKKGLDELSSRDPTYSSNLKKINNNSVLIENYIVGSVGYYRFFLFNANNTRSIAGILEFNKTDKDEATATLNHILQTASLKE